MPTFAEVVEEYSLTLFALGDDNLGVGNSKLASVPLKELLLKLGLELEPKLHVGPTAKYHASFCSARFWPTEDGKCVLASGPGRTISKSGYVVNPPHGVDTDSLARGDALGRYKDNAAVPFSRLYWKKVIDLTADVQAATTSKMKREAKHATHSTELHHPCDESYVMMEELYGLTRDHEHEYGLLLDSVKALPCAVDYAILANAMVVDGMLEGNDHEYEGPIEDLPGVENFDAAVEGHLHAFSMLPSGVVCLTCQSTVGTCKHPYSNVVLVDDYSSASTDGVGDSSMVTAGPDQQSME